MNNKTALSSAPTLTRAMAGIATNDTNYIVA